jgi:speckle-type POZ protein
MSSATRSASAVVFKAAKGFHVFRIDGYSQTDKLHGGECVSSRDFSVGGRDRRVELYPNRADGSKDDSAAVSLFLRIQPEYEREKERVLAQYKFSLLDAAGRAAYELPAETGIFACRGPDEEHDGLRRGYDEFITKEAPGPAAREPAQGRLHCDQV